MRKSIGLSESDLIKKCKSGDLKHQEILYRTYYGYAMGVGMRYLSNRDDAMEVVNDSFIKVFKSIQYFNEDQVFKAWLRRIVVNTSIDTIRKNQKHNQQSDIEEALEVGTNYGVIEHLSAQDILKLLEELPEMHRMVFNLYEIDGYSHEEIGKELEIPVSSSRVFLSRAKDKLLKLLTKQQETDYERSI
jgi:RNA polymerase sigma factor (sigma-70 family)